MVLLAMGLSAGCGGDAPLLRIAVRTDFVPAFEFAEITVEVDGRIERYTPRPGDDFVSGVAAATFSDALADDVSITATLFDREGNRLIDRTVLARVQSRSVVTIVLSRNCLAVECPGDGNPSATECDNGVCVLPTCAAEQAADCGDSVCTTDDDCLRGMSVCGQVRCVASQCLFVSSEGSCGSEQVCLPDAGCVSTAVDGGVPDAGMDAGLDAGLDAGDAGSCEAGLPCTLEGGGGCERGETECSSGVAQCVSAGPIDAGTPCRAAAGVCDVQESCDGSGTECPEDEFMAIGTSCGAGMFCNGNLCSACEAGAACDPPGQPCATGTIQCDGGTPECVASGVRPAGTLCRASAGVCDREETCDGTNALCPTDGFENRSVECRASRGPCDRAESCSGTSAACPADAFQAASQECRSAAGPCDVAESCTGSGPSCPADALRPLGFECNASAGVCDRAETCSGRSASCPSNVFLAAGTECRASTGVCDVAEVCTGSSASCPADGSAADGTNCGDTCGAFGACTSRDCLTADERRTCQVRECMAGVCTTASTYIDTRACTVQNGTDCTLCLPACSGGIRPERCIGLCVDGCCSDLL